MRIALFAAVLSVGLLACGDPLPPIETCEATETLEPICGFQNPEDLALLPEGDFLLVSQFGSMDGAEPGSIALFDWKSREHWQLFPASGETFPAGGKAFPAGGKARRSPTEGWGSADCPGEPDDAFAPHGIQLSRRGDGRLQLLVVNHGGREAIEFFEVVRNGSKVELPWRGCAVPPPDSYINSVVATPEGGFLATHMFPKSSGSLIMLKGMAGFATGYVLEWSPGASFKQVPGSDVAMPNGIELSPDGKTIYLNVYLGSEFKKIRRSDGKTLASIELAQPDNVRWNADGSRLLVASHTGSFSDMLACQEQETGSCALGFEIVSIDPDDLSRVTLVANEGPPMGAATVAVQVGDDLYLGTFKGDRLARAPLPR